MRARMPAMEGNWRFEASSMLLMLAAALTGLAASGGCSMWRKDSDKADKERFDQMLKAPAPPEFVRQAAVAH